MRGDETLDAMVHALRDTMDGSHPTAERTREAILFRVRRRPSRARFVLVALAATLMLGTAWAAVQGGLASTWDEHGNGGTVHLGRDEPAKSVVASSASPGVLRDELSAAAATSTLPPATAIEADPSQPAPTSSSAASSAMHVPSASAKSGTGAAEEQRMYAAAHREHFVDHDPAAALHGWDAYLAAYPRGRFAIEARYNRAIALVRLGKRAEGRAALAPFADGKEGGYRKAEARELLDVLDAADAGP